MTWYVDRSERSGAVDVLTLNRRSPAAALGEALESAAGNGPAVIHWCSTQRLADRVGAAAPGVRTRVRPDLAQGYLEIDEPWDRTADPVLADFRRGTDQPALIRRAGRWELVWPELPAQAIRVDGLAAVPTSELSGLLDRIQAAERREVLLELTIEQFAATRHPMLSEPGVRLALRVGPDVPIPLVAAAVTRKPALAGLRLALTGAMISVAKGSLLSTIAGEVVELSLEWAPGDDEKVAGSIVPQLAMAFRNVPAFTRWSARWQQAVSEPFGLLLTGGTHSGITVVATDVSLVPAELLGPDIMLFAPAGSPDLGQRDLRFDHPDLPAATIARSGGRVLRLDHYGAPVDGSSEEPALRNLSTVADVEAFLADLDAIAATGQWPDPGRAALEFDPILRGREQLSDRRLIFVDRSGLRSSRFGVAGGPGDPTQPVDLGGPSGTVLRAGIAARPDACHYITGLRLRERFGGQVRLAPAAVPSAPLAGWVVGWTPTGPVLAEMSGRRRVFQVAPWVGALVQATQQGTDARLALFAAMETSGSSESECRAVLDRLAA